MKQYQFEYKKLDGFIKDIERVKRFCKKNITCNVLFQIFTKLADTASIEEIIGVIDNEMPNAAYYGCQGYGNIVGGRLSKADTIIVCTIFEYDTTTYELLFIDSDNSSRENAINLLVNRCDENNQIKAVEVISSSVAATRFAIGVKPIELRDDIQVFGGLSGDPNGYTGLETKVFCKGHDISTTAIVLLLIGGEDFYVDSRYVLGWKPLGRHFKVTSCDGPNIRQIDDKPAFEVYQRYLGMDMQEVTFDDIMNFPLLVEKQGVDCLRAPIDFSEDGSILLSLDVDRNTNVCLSYGDKATIHNAVVESFSNISDFCPDVIKVFSCGARRDFWGVEEISSETEFLDDIAPTSGFYTRGELLKVNGFVHHFNCTLVVAAFREGDVSESEHLAKDSIAIFERSSFVERLIHFIGATTEDVESEYIKMISSIASIYQTMHIIDLRDDTSIELNTSKHVKTYTVLSDKASEQMYFTISNVVVSKMQEKALEFTNLETLKERMGNQKTMAMEFVGTEEGWVRAQFVAVSRDENGQLEQVMFTTQIIEEDKKREARLIEMSNTDELTKLGNRHWFEEQINELRREGVPENFILVSADVNGLKKVNDTLGHAAGDELLVGAGQCLDRVFGKYGKVFRIGGDEFQAILYTDESVDNMQQELEALTRYWKGKMVDSLSISIGVVLGKDNREFSIDEIIKFADEQMYRSKEEFYKSGENE